MFCKHKNKAEAEQEERRYLQFSFMHFHLHLFRIKVLDFVTSHVRLLKERNHNNVRDLSERAVIGQVWSFWWW